MVVVLVGCAANTSNPVCVFLGGAATLVRVSAVFFSDSAVFIFNLTTVASQEIVAKICVLLIIDSARRALPGVKCFFSPRLELRMIFQNFWWTMIQDLLDGPAKVFIPEFLLAFTRFHGAADILAILGTCRHLHFQIEALYH